ncbi:hypothetical protein GOP47_0017432 [Adiantum capillus-veneris]|uniref:GDSL esterase/lipase n=1 Tax=Adiantum capillus-veneris TaxID=13818 RepID=A0A9D4UFC9_ADICA|nr:hypothetical protein GOP47_0017432 [Adiantum capillus-veneris]
MLHFISVSFFVALSLSLLCCARDPFPFSPSSPSLPISGKCFPSLFGFGDSKTDTGNRQAFFPFESRSEGPPYGRTFFGGPSDRFCNGRLVIDFQAQAYGLPLLSPYARGLGSDFRHGVNFAVSGSGCIPNVADSVFYLTRQLNQFKKLKALYIDNYATDKSYLSPSEYIGGGLYVISTGENDYRAGINSMGLSSEEVKEQLVPKVVEITYSTVKELYKEGARKFQVVGIAADGCISMMLTRVPHEEPKDLDALGCLTSVNDYVQYHNELLFAAVKSLRAELPDAHVAYGDYFGSNVGILVNASNYGFEETRKACCGVGGNYNYNPVVQCGQTGEVEGNNVTAYSCEDPSKYINWDGIHLTEHFYELIALDFLHGRFVDQPSMLPSSCVLNFSSFNTYPKFGKSFPALKPF